MSKLSSLMVMIGICAFLGNKPTWGAGSSRGSSPTVMPSSNTSATELQIIPAVALQFTNVPSLLVVGAAVAGGFSFAALRRK